MDIVMLLKNKSPSRGEDCTLPTAGQSNVGKSVSNVGHYSTNRNHFYNPSAVPLNAIDIWGR